MQELVKKHKAGQQVGICSVCSAHPLVVEAALRFDLETDNDVLIEATSNQVNQFGGYTGMKPTDFKAFVYQIAEKVNFPKERIILGGDHLGPNCWQNEAAEMAMEKAKALVIDYAKAGFTKIHLDASMSCADDPVPLPPTVIAERAAELCAAVESVLSEEQKAKISYIIGTEVPVLGGEAHIIQCVDVTTVASTNETIETHRKAFARRNLDDAFRRVAGLVVQPGVEFDHSNVILYKPELAQELSKFIETTPYVFEAHSTDYQTKYAYRSLVKDHFAILKVGPALTFALREALFALAKIEDELIPPERKSHLLDVIDQVMQDEPKYWSKYYSPQHSKAMIDLHFSLSDRIRYYWLNERINSAVEKLIANLSAENIPLGLLSQYLPDQYRKVLLKLTRVVNVDIWNIWHMTFTGAIVHIATGSYWLGILGVVIHAAFVYKLGDWFSRDTKNFFELDGIAIPHGTSAYLGPIAVLTDTIIEKIPGLNKVHFSADDLQKRFGPFGEPVTVGFVMGIIIGILAGYPLKDILQLAVKTAAVMLLMPRVIKPIMDGLTPIAKQARKKLQARFGGEEFLIGLDPALLLGHTSVVSASLIFILLTILIAVILPGNQVLPFGDLATIGFFVAMAVAVHQGNLFRMLISGVIIMSITLWIATQTITLNTQLAANAGTLKAGEQVASMDQGGSPITYLLVQLYTVENLIGLLVIGCIYALGVFLTWRRAKGFEKADRVTKSAVKN